jgi:hypothetical protein
MRNTGRRRHDLLRASRRQITEVIDDLNHLAHRTRDGQPVTEPELRGLVGALATVDDNLYRLLSADGEGADRAGANWVEVAP